jgi:8-oxo-dGTP diphosphatase
VQTVVLGALVRDGQVLLALRRADKRAYPGVWDLPGGEVEPGESEPTALAREMHEELGVRIRAGSASHLARVSVTPDDEPVALSAWLVREWSGTPTNAAPDEHADVAWFALDALPPPVQPPLRAALLDAVRPAG